MTHKTEAVLHLGSMPLNAREATRVINCAGRDAGNAHARKHGRSAWTVADYNAAARAANQLFATFGLAPLQP